MSQISLKNSYGKWFFKFWPKWKWCEIKIGYLAAILKRYNIFNFFFQNCDFLQSIHIWCKFHCKIPVGKWFSTVGSLGTPLGHQREQKYLGHLSVKDDRKVNFNTWKYTIYHNFPFFEIFRGPPLPLPPPLAPPLLLLVT